MVIVIVLSCRYNGPTTAYPMATYRTLTVPVMSEQQQYGPLSWHTVSAAVASGNNLLVVYTTGPQGFSRGFTGSADGTITVGCTMRLALTSSSSANVTGV